MAGAYPDVPSRRMAWDADGSILLNWNTQGQDGPILTPIVERSSAVRARLNGEAMTRTEDTYSNFSAVAVIFPELREIDGLFAYLAPNRGTAGINAFKVDSSADTTNGVDGTWSTVFADYADVTSPGIDAYRTNIRSAAVNAHRALRVYYFSNFGAGTKHSWLALHIYGEISPGETPDKVLFIDEATGLEFTLPIDFGDTPRGGSEDFEFRLRNDSATLTATTVQYTAESLFQSSGSWYTFTLPGGATFQSTQQIASIAPATTSGLITGRRITPAAEVLSVHAARIKAVHTSMA